MILFNLIFLLWTMLPKLESSLIYFFYLYTTIRPKYIVLFDLFFLLCMSIRSKIRVFIILFCLFVLENSIKTRNHSYSLIYSFQNCANILYAMFMVVLPLYFVHYIDYFGQRLTRCLTSCWVECRAVVKCWRCFSLSQFVD